MLDADDLLRPAEDPQERGALAEACLVLTNLLQAGPRSAEECNLEAQLAGIAEIRLKRAKYNLGVQSFLHGCQFGTWYWERPDAGTEGDHPPQRDKK